MNCKGSETGFGIVIVAHGQLAYEYLATLQHVIGAQPRIHAVAIQDGDKKEAKQDEIVKLAESIDVGSGVVIATDMLGATPSNLARNWLAKDQYHILYGINMPALIKLAQSRHKSVKAALQEAVSAGHRYLDFCNSQR